MICSSMLPTLVFFWNVVTMAATTDLFDNDEVVRFACAANFCHSKNPVWDNWLDLLNEDKTYTAGPGVRWSEDMQRSVTCWNICGNDPTFLNSLGLTAESIVPPKKFLKRARAAVNDYYKRADECIEKWDSIVQVDAKPLNTLPGRVRNAMERCGVCFISGLFNVDPESEKFRGDTDFPWLSDAWVKLKVLQRDKALTDLRSRIEGGGHERETEDVLVPADGNFLLDGFGDMLTSPPLLKSIANYFDTELIHSVTENAPGNLQLSYASWIAAPPEPLNGTTVLKSLKVQHLHADLSSPGIMVSAQLTLHDIDAYRGPTGYCPSTHLTDDVSMLRLMRAAMTERGRKAEKVQEERPVCAVKVPLLVRRGTVIIYDSSLLHAGTTNHWNHTRIVLNANFASGSRALYEEHYEHNFRPHPNTTGRQKILQNNVVADIDWMRSIFNSSFYRGVLKNSTCDHHFEEESEDTSVVLKEEKKDLACDFEKWASRRKILQERLDANPTEAEAAEAESSNNTWTIIGLGAIFLVNMLVKRVGGEYYEWKKKGEAAASRKATASGKQASKKKR